MNDDIDTMSVNHTPDPTRVVQFLHMVERLKVCRIELLVYVVVSVYVTNHIAYICL